MLRWGPVSRMRRTTRTSPSTRPGFYHPKSTRATWLWSWTNCCRATTTSCGLILEVGQHTVVYWILYCPYFLVWTIRIIIYNNVFCKNQNVKGPQNYVHIYIYIICIHLNISAQLWTKANISNKFNWDGFLTLKMNVIYLIKVYFHFPVRPTVIETAVYVNSIGPVDPINMVGHCICTSTWNITAWCDTCWQTKYLITRNWLE